MKWILILMIFLSLFVGIPVNGEWRFLFGFEFPSVIEMIKAGMFSESQIVEWVLLLITHFIIICLPFLTQHRYFRHLLIITPALFMFLYLILGGLGAVFLTPFAIVWVIAVFKQGRMQKT